MLTRRQYMKLSKGTINAVNAMIEVQCFVLLRERLLWCC